MNSSCIKRRTGEFSLSKSRRVFQKKEHIFFFPQDLFLIYQVIQSDSIDYKIFNMINYDINQIYKFNELILLFSVYP